MELVVGHGGVGSYVVEAGNASYKKLEEKLTTVMGPLKTRFEIAFPSLARAVTYSCHAFCG